MRISILTVRVAVFFCYLLIGTAPALSESLQPLDAVQKEVNAGLRILNAPEFRAPGRSEEKQKQLRIILERLFDFEEFSRRVLASRWSKFTPSQQVNFVNVFTEFLSKYYIGKLLERYKDERVSYLRQTLESPTRAMVHVEVIWRDNSVPVDLPMIKRSGTWKIYEIQILGISAISFYRAQFKYLLSKETPAQVIERIEKRIRKIDSTQSGLRLNSNLASAQLESSIRFTGRLRMRLPVAENTALVTAGETGGTPTSPIPVGGRLLSAV